MAGHCPVCFIRLPLSGEPNCDCEPRAVGGPVAQGSPIGTHGHPHTGEAGIDRSNGVVIHSIETPAWMLG